MLMPDKHIKFSESILGLSAYLLECLREPQTIDELWGTFRKRQRESPIGAEHTFENVVLAVDTLFAIGAITEENIRGVLKRCA